MKKFVKATLLWNDEKNGGRKIISGENLTYRPIIRFNNYNLLSDWSSEIRSSKLIDANTTEIELSFGSKEAPFELLTINNKFELYEGAKLVGTGIIIEE